MEVPEMSVTQATDRRDWDWDRDDVLEGMYVETRQVTVKSGPSAGKSKIVFDFHTGLDDELVSVWETVVLKSKLREQLKRRGKPDFEAGERFVITPTGMKQGPNGAYRDFDIEFEHAAPKPTTAELLADKDSYGDEQDDAPEIPF
jgi:hypothetical protein